ncbi:MAG: hypothetical protein KTR30_34235 [Saprospiraceae bacterium]|nr:hypothetical protein [Saprospiraceae bacterium]
MTNSRFGSLFIQLSASERRSFSKFIASPFFNQQGLLEQLWDCILSYFEKQGVLADKEYLFEQLYPKKTYKDQQMRLLISRLYQKLLEYLAYEEAISSEAQMKLYEAQALRKKQLDKHFERSLSQARAKVEEQGYRNAEYWQFNFQLQLEGSRRVSKTQYSGQEALQNLSNTIDLTYFTAKLRHICLLLTHQKVYQSQFEIGMLEEMLSYITERKLLREPAIACYYYYYYTLIEPNNNEHFQHFKVSLFEHSQQFPAEEIRDLFLLAINYCVKKGNSGDQAFIYEMLELYKAGLATDVFLDQGELSHFTFHNIATAGLKTKDYEWVGRFIEDYKNQLARQHRESSYSFNQARLAYAQGQYQTALPLLQKANYRDLLLNLAAKTLLLKIYYELDEFDLLNAHLDAMKNFIRRKAVIGYHRTNYLNIIRFSKKLANSNLYDRERRKSLRDQIQAAEVLTEKEWLLEQL